MSEELWHRFRHRRLDFDARISNHVLNQCRDQMLVIELIFLNWDVGAGWLVTCAYTCQYVSRKHRPLIVSCLRFMTHQNKFMKRAEKGRAIKKEFHLTLLLPPPCPLQPIPALEQNSMTMILNTGGFQVGVPDRRPGRNPNVAVISHVISWWTRNERTKRNGKFSANQGRTGAPVGSIEPN